MTARPSQLSVVLVVPLSRLLPVRRATSHGFETLVKLLAGSHQIMGSPPPPPLWDLPPPPPPPWLEDPLTSCAEDGGCTDIPTVSTLTPGLPSIFHSVTVILVSSITLVISLILVAAFFCRHRSRRQKQLGMVGEEEYKQRSSPNQYMGEGRVTSAAGATMPKLVSPQKVWSSVTLSCPHSTMTIFPSPCSHTTIPPSPIYETIDESFASEPVYESGSIYNHNHERGKVTRAERPPLDSVKGCQRPFRSLKEPQGRPQSSIPRLVTVRSDGWEEVEGWQRFARHSFRSSDFL